MALLPLFDLKQPGRARFFQAPRALSAAATQQTNHTKDTLASAKRGFFVKLTFISYTIILIFNS
jgi:hypothetical protein